MALKRLSMALQRGKARVSRERYILTIEALPSDEVGALETVKYSSYSGEIRGLKEFCTTVLSLSYPLAFDRSEAQRGRF